MYSVKGDRLSFFERRINGVNLATAFESGRVGASRGSLMQPVRTLPSSSLRL